MYRKDDENAREDGIGELKRNRARMTCSGA
jgi:hypothetical protein